MYQLHPLRTRDTLIVHGMSSVACTSEVTRFSYSPAAASVGRRSRPARIAVALRLRHEVLQYDADASPATDANVEVLGDELDALLQCAHVDLEYWREVFIGLSGGHPHHDLLVVRIQARKPWQVSLELLRN